MSGSEPLDRRRLLAARVAWLAVAVLAVSLFVIAVPAQFWEFTSVCTREAQVCGENRLLVPDQMRELGEAGLSAGFYAAYNVALGVGFALACFVAGAVIFLRRSDERMALMVSLMLVVFGSSYLISPQVVLDAYPALGLPYRFVALAGLALFTLVVYTFPDGRFVPRWAIVPALVWILNNILSIFFSQAVEEDEILGHRIPKGAHIVISPYVTHRLPDLWEDPERFDPERFSPEGSAGRPRYAYFPFGGGPRQCIGKGMALVEAQLILATVAQRYRLRLASDRPVRPEALVTLRPRGGLPMIPELI